MTARIHIGTSGWSYDHWEHGILYPDSLPVSQRLDVYTTRFHTVELNSSFYRWPTPAAFTSWRRRLPEGFRLSVKAPRSLTHAKRLYAPEDGLARIIAGLARLGDKGGPLLVQTPPTLAFDGPRLRYFLERLPSDLCCAFEFRHPTWHQEETYALLENRPNTAYCVMSGAHLPCVLRATGSFVYVRLHGPDPSFLYGGSYTDDNLRWWADRVREWQGQGRAVFVYFNNDGEGNAVRNALTLRWLVGA